MLKTEAPDSVGRADAAHDFASAYVHVPFCARVCPYCDFAVVAGRDDLADRYLSALEREIASAPPWRPLDAVFVGGGTPSRFGAVRLALIVAALRERFGLAPDAEVTLEANPEDWTPRLAGELVAAGYTRVSFGAQSFDDRVLVSLGRRHQPEAIGSAVTVARAAGFGSVSIDLIFGTPGEALQTWELTLEQAVALGTDHVSCYALTVERGTPLGRAVAGGAPAPDPDLQADEWEAADRVLTAAGFVRYEVSNWARPGHECRYNLAVWAQGEYAAFGNGAHGFLNGERFANIRRLDAYLDRVEAGASPRASSERLAGWDAETDRLFVGLRRVAGVAHGPGVEALLASPDGARLLDADVISHDGERLRVTRPLLTDEVERAVLGLRSP
ncbi:MAG TPA: radical SAM family heme chaperone HemW [Acidimicrobiia bacterium]|nr:radical SAM family heme chaperone HemW [Acidimicrobiia bacterium]